MIDRILRRRHQTKKRHGPSTDTVAFLFRGARTPNLPFTKRALYPVELRTQRSKWEQNVRFQVWASLLSRLLAKVTLVHVVGDADDQRGDLFEKRRELMEAWA